MVKDVNRRCARVDVPRGECGSVPSRRRQVMVMKVKRSERSEASEEGEGDEG